MLNSNTIKKILGIKDPNITIFSVTEEKYHGEGCLMVKSLLRKDLKNCPLCGSPNKNHSIIHNGTKSSKILLNKSNNQKTYLDLKKQRYYCRDCASYFTAATYLVAPYCFIARQVRYNILFALKENISEKNIAKHCKVSSTTVQRILKSAETQIRVKKNWLPECLLFDEFRSLKTPYGKFAFSCMDGKTGKVFDILPSRRKDYLIDYFLSFDLKARQSVHYVVTDMNAPYDSVVRACFPNAKLIIDRFHIVQYLNRCFDDTRKQVMKKLNKNIPKEVIAYRQLKSLYKLLLKPQHTLDFEHFIKRRNFHWAYLTETEVVDHLLTISEELKGAYHYYQALLDAYHNRDSQSFFSLIHHLPSHLSQKFKTLKNTFTKYESGITLALKFSYSNAKLENLHTHIKNLKRTAYGFKNFSNMKIRIFLLNGLITIK